jgi:N-methylhydantoinase A
MSVPKHSHSMIPPPTPSMPCLEASTDIGGTFTDLVLCAPDGSIRTEKTDSTKPYVERGVINVLAKALVRPNELARMVHGSTVVINALTERKGAHTALITTRGFRDILEIGRGNRPDVFNFRHRKPEPFVPRRDRYEVTERVLFDGTILAAAEVAEVGSIVEQMKRDGVESVGICFLHSYANAENERLVKAEVKRLWPDICVVASSDFCHEWREYERTSTTVLAAYVLPRTNTYLDTLESALRQERFDGKLYVMRSNGGIASIAASRSDPIALIESGPASGILGAALLGAWIGENNLLALDIGGTTAKCSLIKNGVVALTTDYYIERSRHEAGYPIRTPVVDLIEIGAGGGSVAWLDEAGGLHVGPESAGSQPGPVAYGRGGRQATTTDANILTGRIDPDNLLGGLIKADMPGVVRAFEKLGAHFNQGARETALGVIRIANSAMVQALKLVSLNRGHDPRDFTLIAFGGGGAMHAVELAQELEMRRILVPIHSGVFSAWGMIMTDLRRDYFRTHVDRWEGGGREAAITLFGDLIAQAQRDFAGDGVGPEALAYEFRFALRYVGQDHGVWVTAPTTNGAVQHEEVPRFFHAEHERLYTFSMDQSIELVAVHLLASAHTDRPRLQPLPPGDTVAHPRAHRMVDFDDKNRLETPIYVRTQLAPGTTLAGPAIIEEPATTTVVLPGWHVEVDCFGNLILTHTDRGVV